MLFGRISILVSIDAPVVVNPEAVSKKASTNVFMEPVKRKGSIPNRDNKNHPNATIANPSFARISLFIFVASAFASDSYALSLTDIRSTMDKMFTQVKDKKNG